MATEEVGQGTHSAAPPQVVVVLAWIVVGAELGWLANSAHWFLGGALWPLGGAVLGAVAYALPWVRQPVHRAVERSWRTLLPHAAWIQGALLGFLVNELSSDKVLDTVGTVVLVSALAVGYFVEANALVDLAPDHFEAYATLAGALLGAVAGVVANSGGWFLGGLLWPAGGAVVGAAAGFFLWAPRPPPLERRMRIPERWRPVIFLAPALSFVAATLVIPTLRTIYLSFWDRDAEEFVGTKNYRSVFTSKSIFSFDGFGDLLTSRLFVVAVVLAAVALTWVVLRGTTTRRGIDMSAPVPVISLTTTAFLVVLAGVGALSGVVWNNVFWIVLATGFSVVIGLAIAVLADRAKGETLAKSLIFMPMAISFVGASVIWRFIYAFNPAGDQFGLVNAIWSGFGGEPRDWVRVQPWNDLFLIVIMIWIQTGFAMVVFSAAIKSVPTELQEAARVDGASEGQTFWRITVPHIRSTIGVVVTTLIVTVLKIYDIVRVMTNGEGDTDVIANRMYTEAFINRNRGLGSTLAVLLFVAVVPLMIINVRRLRRAEEVAR
jgi:ABC-type sugar transport system permease subunit